MSGSSTPSPSSSISSISSSTSPRTPANLHQNNIDPAAKWLVQKFGGTSVGKFATKIAEDIVSEYLDQHKVAIVCSARSGSTKTLGTTNLLLRAAKEALQHTHSPSGTPGNVTPALHTSQQSPVDSPRPPSGSSPRTEPFSPGGLMSMSTMSLPPPAFNSTVDIIRSEHINAARSSVRDPDLLKELEAEIERDCDGLRSFLVATQVIDEISPRSRDSIIGYGERLACKVMAATLRDRGIDAEFVSLENVVPLSEDGETYSDTETLGQDFYDRVAEAVSERIKHCGPRVPVVTGSLLRQVGRGYTDLLAALLAAGLNASELQIWKEVDGIFTADPRKVPTARLIPIISPEEAAELTYYGSEVVHPFTMEQVIRKKIPIRIKNVENPQGGGTVIHPDPDIDAIPYPDDDAGIIIPTTNTFIPISELARVSSESPERKLPTAVTIKEHIVVLNVNSNRKSVSHGFLAGVFGTLDRYGVVVDLISTSEVYVSMAIEDHLDKKVLDRVVRELRKSGTVTVSRDMAILSLVGKKMRNMVGIAGRMFTTLGHGNINIEMISQGANEINISCVIDARDAVKALNLIHQSCLQITPEGARGRGG
ncbi:aspartate kinase [Laetiporus sulphureus 93-53]|uniref:aspartate kinase n=1 Tax=Laetiporus sulphureus 93-53 TaxID=1314785 RepID=A0A165BB10_9APHY|nr:aspartate kinase [Laetiporus sulphureus 93-53]KZT00650.1 aspartate kinase [Laetiporus sulphureus 93-53]